MVMPIVYMLSTSLKWPHEVYNLKLIPDEPTLENYTYVLEDGRFYGWFLNSLFIATVTTVSNVLFDSLVGYTLCKFRFPGRYIVFIAILSTLMIPTEMLVIPWYLDVPAVRLAGQLLGHHVPGPDDGLRHLSDEAVLRDGARRLHRGRADRRAERVADLVDGGDAAGDARARGAGDLRLPGQLDRVHLAADRHQLGRDVHACRSACRPSATRRTWHGS